MSKSIRANMELASVNDIRTIISKDAPIMATNAKKFLEDNILGYYVMINTWLICVKQWSKYGWMYLHDILIKNGFYATMTQFSEAADQVVNGVAITNQLCRAIYDDVARANPLTHVPVDPEKLIGSDTSATALFLFRYPKRFSPVSNDKIQQASLTDFLAVENRTKLLQRRGYPEYLINSVREVLSRINWKGFLDDIGHLSPEQITYTSGVGFDSRTSLGSKLLAVSSEMPEAFIAPFGIPYSGAYPQNEVTTWGKYSQDTVRKVAVRAVPKSYKASRIIAMEDTYRQAKAKRYFRALDKYLPDEIDLHDQTKGQNYAYLGSVSGELATIDLSHASDCISKLLFRQIFPEEAVRVIDPLLANFNVINGVTRLTQQMSTAGNALTFILESLVFWAISRAACEWASLFQEDPQPIHLCIYGDDIGVPTQYAQTVIEWLEKLGFRVNTSKSYYSPELLYRESCGAEYYKGINVSSLYYPRFPIQGKFRNDVCVLSDYTQRDGFIGSFEDSTSSLIDLQHKLYRVCVDASIFVEVLVKEAHPKMTTSPEVSTAGDLWGYLDVSQKRYAPASEILEDPKGSDKKVLRTLKIDGMTRTYRYVPRQVAKLVRKLSEMEERLYNLYLYQSFLEHGPFYEDALSELIGVSAPRRNVERDFGRQAIAWGFHEVEDNF